jgi:hexulose-6-phosphate isomerase
LAFESDFPPAELVRLLNRLPCDTFGVNYDTGNSAARGYTPEEEFSAYGPRIFNVHIKDRILGGTTVPLGTGDADFLTVFRLLRAIAYSGNLIMQTARASDNNHAGVLCQYIKQIEGWSRVF